MYPRVTTRSGGPHEEAPARARRRRRRRTAASAGGWATVGLSSLPPDRPEGRTTVADRHHRAPARPDAARRRDAGAPHPRRQRQRSSRRSPRTPTGKPGVYHTVVAFPESGTYSLRGLRRLRAPTAAPRRTRSRPSTIGASGWRLVPVPAGRASQSALALALAALLLARRSRRASPSRRPSPDRGGCMKKLLAASSSLRSPLRRRRRAGRPRRPAGCWATVGLTPLPQPGLQAGEPWIVTIRVLQHGRTPLAGAKPEIRIRNGRQADRLQRQGTRARRSYRARVVFPAAGRCVAHRVRRLRAALRERAHVQVRH